jgi:hypothetical protein
MINESSNIPDSNIVFYNKLTESDIIPTEYYSICINKYEVRFQGIFCSDKVKRIEEAIQRITKETGLLGYEGKFSLCENTRMAEVTFPYHQLKVTITLT